jgi:2-(1,2-epoxy-1,2-dihydrophenyl)acetyl-CoA isomerase
MTFQRSIQGTAALVTIDRPEKRNALTLPQLEELAALIRGLGDDPAITGLVLTGNGAFCAGADLKTIVAKGKEGPGGIRDTIEEVPQQVIRALLDVPFPTVAAINGPAIGLGMDIALACDSRLIARSGWMMQGWGRVGLIPGTGGELLLHERNPSILWRLLEDQPAITADDAERWGIGEAVDADDDAVPGALRRIERLSALPRAALETYVALYRSSLKTRLDEHLAICAQAQVSLLTDARFESRVDHVMPATT